ncbi:hyaluronidase PH-20 isoform X2 [Ctenopharyngodon idella]|uniref:hyaluronidase PH-20 isoform X2 n=1 Tax=Ctenopharyngodon idella TaxID=7959 RepID=UPI00222FBC9A|nr:hyaluronidase PH-20 isoform X2 [Ctenopharyngodon idella]
MEDHRKQRLPFYIILFMTFGYLNPSLSPLPTAAPLFHKPFVLLWNAPISKCQQMKIPLDLSMFQVVTTPSRVRNQSLTLFYKNRLGLYPYVDLHSLKEYNGGIPQRGNLSASLEKAKEEFTQYIPDSTAGLAVMDWEEWLPMFDRNWDVKEIYKELSINYTLEQNASLNLQQASIEAKRQFQKEARCFMEETLKMGLYHRPLYLWGYYLFPDCYNYDFEESNYTGTCSENTKQLNNELQWLWEVSTALYPSAYLPVSVSESKNAALFVRHQVQEAMRVAALPKHRHTAPVYVYLRPLLRDQKELYMNETSCEALSTYLSDTLNPYIANVTTAAHLCSKSLCQGNGRCVRKNYNSDDYLHISSESHQIIRKDGKYVVTGSPSPSDFTYWEKKFTCQCYEDRKCTAMIPSF